jgi:hypothetical protein
MDMSEGNWRRYSNIYINVIWNATMALKVVGSSNHIIRVKCIIHTKCITFSNDIWQQYVAHECTVMRECKRLSKWA